MAAVTKFIILLLPAFVWSFIDVRIDLINSQPLKVLLSGSHDELLTDKDRELFQIRDHELKQGLYLLSGSLPDYVEVGYPYSHQMHTDYSWQSVRRKIVPIESEIIRQETRELVAGPVLYPACDYDFFPHNDLIISSRWDAGQFNSTETTSYYFWLDQGNQDLNYKHKKVSYIGEFGKRHDWNSGVKPGSGIRSDISLYGKQAAMHVKLKILEIEIKYELSLHGSVACSYNEGPKSSYHWPYDVNACLKAADRSTKKYVSEVISVIFYYDDVFRLAT